MTSEPKTFEDALNCLAGDCLALLVTKQRDYGGENIRINQRLFGYQQFVTRLLDKVLRLRNLLGTKSVPNFESIEDTFIDIANYALIALMLRRGWWELPLEEAESE